MKTLTFLQLSDCEINEDDGDALEFRKTENLTPESYRIGWEDLTTDFNLTLTFE